MQRDLRFATYTHILPVESTQGVYAIWSALWLRALFVSAAYLPAIKMIQQGATIGQLVEQSGLTEAEINDFVRALEENNFLESDIHERKIREVRDTLPTHPIGILYLMLSKACNLRCPYCYVHNFITQREPALLMSKEVARKGVELFSNVLTEQEEGVEEPFIFLYGGEPTLNWEVIQDVIPLAKEQIPGVQVVVNTNGTLITDEMAKFLAQYDVLVSVSIDGPPEIHNIYRINYTGKGTFDSTYRGYQLLRKHGVKTSISCTVNSDNVDKLPQIMSWLIRDLEIDTIGFNLLIGEYPGDIYAQTAADGIIEAYKIARQHNVYVDQVMRRLLPFSQGELNLYDCGGAGQQIVVTPDGKVGLCQAFLNEEGEPFFFPMEEFYKPEIQDLWKKWKMRSPFMIEECLSCEALGICGGGCFYSGYINHGNIMGLDKVHCSHAKRTLRFLLNELYEQSVAESAQQA